MLAILVGTVFLGFMDYINSANSAEEEARIGQNTDRQNKHDKLCKHHYNPYRDPILLYQWITGEFSAIKHGAKKKHAHKKKKEKQIKEAKPVNTTSNLLPGSNRVPVNNTAKTQSDEPLLVPPVQAQMQNTNVPIQQKKTDYQQTAKYLPQANAQRTVHTVPAQPQIHKHTTNTLQQQNYPQQVRHQTANLSNQYSQPVNQGAIPHRQQTTPIVANRHQTSTLSSSPQQRQNTGNLNTAYQQRQNTGNLNTRRASSTVNLQANNTQTTQSTSYFTQRKQETTNLSRQATSNLNSATVKNPTGNLAQTKQTTTTGNLHQQGNQTKTNLQPASRPQANTMKHQTANLSTAFNNTHTGHLQGKAKQNTNTANKPKIVRK
jgi:hypothetical protein